MAKGDWEVGRRIRLARKHAGLSVDVLAGLVGRCPASVYRWEVGRTCPDNETLREIARVTQVSLIWLMFGDADMHLSGCSCSCSCSSASLSPEADESTLKH